MDTSVRHDDVIVYDDDDDSSDSDKRDTLNPTEISKETEGSSDVQQDLQQRGDDYGSTDRSGLKPTPADDEQKPEPTLMRKILVGLCGYSTCVLGFGLLTTSAGCAQALGGYVPPFELNMLRYTVTLLFTLPFLLYNAISVWPSNVKTGLCVAVYCLLNNIYNFAFYTACIYMPLVILGGFEVSSLVWFSAVTTIVMSRKFNSLVITASVFCIFGVLCVTQPPLFGTILSQSSPITYPVCYKDDDFGNNTLNTSASLNSSSGSEGEQDSISDVPRGYILLLVAAVSFIAQLYLMNFHLQGTNVFMLSFWKGLSGIIISVLLMSYLETPTFPKNTACIFLLLGHSVSLSLSSILLTFSIVFVPPLALSFMNFLQMVFFIIAQYTAMRSVNNGQQNVVEVVGGALIVFGSMVAPGYQILKNLQDDEEDSDYIPLK